MAIGKDYRFSNCEALTPDGKAVSIPEGVYPVAETDVISIAIRGRIVDITRSCFELMKLDRKVTER